MYCNHCGKPNEDGSKICTSCGLEIQRTEDAVIPSNQQPTQPTQLGTKIDFNEIGQKISNLSSNIDTEKIKNKLEGLDKKKTALYAGIAGGSLAVIIALILIITSFTSKVSLKKYMPDELVFSGINGYGTVDTYDLIDYDSLNQVIINQNPKDDYYYSYSDIRDYISYECASDNDGTLSNGDEVEIVVTVNKDGIKNNKMFKKKISGGETQKFKYTVEGLPEGTAIDIFDAVESVEYDTTSYYSGTTIKLKENYVRDYGTDGINVKTENNYVVVYGDNFNSFYVGLSIASDNYDENSTTIKLKTNSEPDQYKDYGIVLSETEKNVPATIIKYVSDDNITQEDLNELDAKEKEYASEQFDGEKVTLTKKILFVDSQSPNTTLTYFYKNSEGKFYVIYYDGLKITNSGRIYGIEELTPKKEGWFGFATYESINEYKQEITYDNEFNIALK